MFKKFVPVILGLGLLCFTSVVYAYPRHSLSVGIGGVFPYTEIDTGPLGAGDQKVGDNGGMLGFRYLYAATPRIDVGGGIEFAGTGKAEFVSPPFVGEQYMDSTLLMVQTKIHPASSNAFVPYFLGGLGLHVTEYNFDMRPSPGFVWTSGNPTETRSIFSDTQTGIAAMLGVGVDYNFSKNFFMSLEGRLDILSEEEYEATPTGQAMGFTTAETGAVNGVFQLRLAWRFGAETETSAADAPPPTPQEKAQPAKTEGAL